MNKIDWENAFPKPTDSFHDKLCKTLDSLGKESIKMKRTGVKKSIIIAAAILAIGTVSFASTGAVRYITGSSSAKPDYTSLPSSERLEENMGVSPKLLNEFSNGYVFENGSDVKNKVMETEDGKESRRDAVADYNSISLRYTKDGDELIFHADAEIEAHRDDDTDVAETYNGAELRYNSFVNKFVPADYEKTERDIEDEANGLVFSYGTEEVEVKQIQGVYWEQDGIYYSMTAIDSPLDKQTLLDMAKEVIDY